jgi:ABC-type enterochelin transport system permease subunit
MERTIISWNLPNWITILLMASAGYAVLGLMVQVLKQNQGGGS